MVLALTLMSGLSQARVLCDPNESSCFFSDMPLYNQLHAKTNGSMSCGPTAAAMSLQAVVNEMRSPANLKATSYTQTKFIANTPSLTFNEREKAQIAVLQTQLGTNSSGTYSNVMYKAVSGRAADFKTAGGANTGYPIAYPNSSYIGYLKTDKSAVTLLYGHYTKTKTVSNGKTYYSYARNGGHYVTVNGFSGDTLLTYDPYGGYRTERQITMVKGGCANSICENLPGGLSSRALLFGTKFVDHHTRLWAD